MNKPRLNREWHLKNRMPAKATFDQRVTWHLEHIQHCACRNDVPPAIRQELEDRGIDVNALLTGSQQE